MDIVKNNFLLPTLKLDDQKFEFIFLLDRSGSMAGGRIELAKRALNLFLHSLPASCYFNIVYFDNTFGSIFPQSVKYEQSTLDQAKRFLSNIQGQGGTNILGPLNYVYNNKQIPGYLTQIFALTDGEVSAPDQVLQLVGTKVKHSRAFSLGVGSGASRHLVEGIAKRGGGIAEFVMENEQIEEKILYQLKIALKPALLKPIRVTGQGKHSTNSPNSHQNILPSFF